MPAHPPLTFSTCSSFPLLQPSPFALRHVRARVERPTSDRKQVKTASPELGSGWELSPSSSSSPELSSRPPRDGCHQHRPRPAASRSHPRVHPACPSKAADGSPLLLHVPAPAAQPAPTRRPAALARGRHDARRRLGADEARRDGPGLQRRRPLVPAQARVPEGRGGPPAGHRAGQAEGCGSGGRQRVLCGSRIGSSCRRSGGSSHSRRRGSRSWSCWRTRCSGRRAIHRTWSWAGREGCCRRSCDRRGSGGRPRLAHGHPAHARQPQRAPAHEAGAGARGELADL